MPPRKPPRLSSSLIVSNLCSLNPATNYILLGFIPQKKLAEEKQAARQAKKEVDETYAHADASVAVSSEKNKKRVRSCF